MKHAQAFSKIDVVLATTCQLELRWQRAFQHDLGPLIKIAGGDSQDDRYSDNLIRIDATPVIKAHEPKVIDVGPISIGYGLYFNHCLAK